jgi:pyrimidine-nucleoside phosphorylase
VPIVAECGVFVPMMSGRALGHTGGTLDKLEAIPGFRTGLTVDEMKSILREVGAVMMGQTTQVAPADKKLYALRDVTATVECIPLIAASIMSKKMAEGIDALVLDVKFGGGAFIKDPVQSRLLAQTMVAIGKASGVRTRAVLSAMDAPLGNAIGNALEVIECLQVLRGSGPKDLTELSLQLAARLVQMTDVARTWDEAWEKVNRAWRSGAALERWRRIVERQGGDPRYIDEPARLPLAPCRQTVTAPHRGYVTAIGAEPLGRAAMRLGAGRQRAEDRVDHGVGIRLAVRVGDQVQAGDLLAEIFARSPSEADQAALVVKQVCHVGEAPMPHEPLVRDVID